ncbi:MAG: DUF4037 domain-containing protein [Clostridiales Family XIII bacterium]|nr:DUF4037 domain-containing protein [Clostridiales Family XIII bacterium]
MLQRQFPEVMPRIASGLVGEGSECFGFDDELSRDHDFGAGFCIWLSDADYERYGTQMAQEYDMLPNYMGETTRISNLPNFQINHNYPKKPTHTQGIQRVGVMRISDFYRRYTGMDVSPFFDKRQHIDIDWERIPEANLATVTNGTVFYDASGDFTRVREMLLAYYPDFIWRKKLSARIFEMAQAGQYNYGRCLKRGDMVAAEFALARFKEATCAVVHLLSKKYMPFYKWAYRSVGTLPKFSQIHQLLALATVGGGDTPNITDIPNIIEAICLSIILEMKKQGLTNCHSTFLVDHCEFIARS